MAAPTDAAAVTPYVHESAGVRVVFGPGGLDRLGDELGAAGIRRALLVDGLEVAGVLARARAAMGAAYLGTLGPARQHVPVEDAEAARRRAREVGADGLVALGGGSAIGLAKAVALTDGIPIVAVPTTYAGSEMTPIWGMTKGESKTTGRDLRVAPRVVVYDPELTHSLPPGPTAASGMNAVAHCVEALWTAQASPLTDAVATEGLALLSRGLRTSVAEPGDPHARATALKGAWLAGTALAGAGTALHHKLCHVLGGFGMPHAEVHTALLPVVAAHLADSAPSAMARVAGALEADDAPAALRQLTDALGGARTLAAMGLTAEQAREAAGLVAVTSPVVPRAVGSDEVVEMLVEAGAPA